MKRVLIFLKPFSIKNPTIDEQNSYLISLWADKAAMGKIGDFVDVNALQKLNYEKEVRRVVAEQKPYWIIAAEESATACLNLYCQRKILINPTVTFNDLNHVPEYAHRYTFGFFDTSPGKEKSYELFQTVYPNSTLYLGISELRFADIKNIIHEIVNYTI